MIRDIRRQAVVSFVCLLVSCASSFADNLPTTTPTSDELLDEVQKAGFQFFYDHANPVSGLSREYSDQRPEVCATGANGMGFFNIVVGAQRGFVTREQAARHIQKCLHFLAEKVDRFHGVFPHWFNGQTGKTVPFSQYDDGGDLVETGFLAEGFLEVREYFTANDPVEADVRALADRLWREIDWSWHVKDDGTSAYLLWHWSPNYSFGKNH
jgi:hypothetical protein